MRRATSTLLVALAFGCARKTSPPKLPAAPATAASPSAPSEAYAVRMGQLTFQHYCQTCHGASGAGDGFNAFNLDPRPRDLSDPRFQAKKSDADLLDAVRRGGSGVGLTALMPPWGRTLSPREIEQVVQYVRTFRRVEEP